MRVPKSWMLGLVVILTACGGSSPAFYAATTRAEREAPRGLRETEFGERELDGPDDKPNTERRSRDGDTAGAWWVSAKESRPAAKR
jgi:hypothetical protein